MNAVRAFYFCGGNHVYEDGVRMTNKHDDEFKTTVLGFISADSCFPTTSDVVEACKEVFENEMLTGLWMMSTNLVFIIDLFI